MRAVRFVGNRACRAKEYRAALKGKGVAVIDALPDGGNVTLRFEIDGKPLRIEPSNKVRDLLDLAVAIYIADEVLARTKAQDRWSRSFNFLFPVEDPRSWNATTSILQKTLHTLSGDHFEFIWPKRGKISGIGKKHRACLPKDCDVVCLFSGGIDSLLGAIHALEQEKRVLLVGHQSESITASAQSDLFESLHAEYPGKVYLVQSRVARSQGAINRQPLPKKCEDSHRPRSFLFLGLAVTIAATAKVDQILLPENGLIALNAPLQKSRLGTLSTRTAHPLFLSQFCEFLPAVGAFSGTLKNPFLYQSKTDMLLNLDARWKDLVVRSVSCAHAGDVRWIGKRGTRHCGYCVPCIYRRVAMMAVGWDNPDHYGFDVFQKLSSLTTHKQADFRALVGFASRVVDATPAGRDLMVLSHGIFDPDVGEQIGPHAASSLDPWSEMLLRWATDFLDRVSTQSSPSTRRVVGLPMVRRMAGPV